jgi:hypothetical protein
VFAAGFAGLQNMMVVASGLAAKIDQFFDFG